MRTTPIILTIIFLICLTAFIIHGNSGRWRCYRNLMMIDHSLNCHGCVQIGKSEGIIDSEGNWKMDKSNWLFDTIQTNILYCPVSGKKYNVSYVVGSHPKCLTHGNLIQFYGYVPHQQTLRSVFWHFAPVVAFFGTLTCAIWTIVLFAITLKRKKEGHNK